MSKVINYKDNIFIGAWISPLAKVYWNNTQSHLAAIKEMHIDQYLISIRDSLDWTHEEQRSYRYNDLPYIALKIGYIRILLYNDQIAIQHGAIITLQQIDKIKYVLNQIILNTSYTSFIFIIERFEQSFKMLYNLNDVINELTREAIMINNEHN